MGDTGWRPLLVPEQVYARQGRRTMARFCISSGARGRGLTRHIQLCTAQQPSFGGWDEGGCMRLPVLLALIMAATDLTHSQSVTPGTASAADTASAPVSPSTITLRDAIDRAKANSPAFRQALLEYGIAQQDRFQARVGLLPSVAYNNQFIYTEGNGTPSGVFIANNGVHEYVSQADVHQALSFTQLADYRR